MKLVKRFLNTRPKISKADKLIDGKEMVNQWISSQATSHGTFVNGLAYPFPLNPTYKPIPPISNKTRSDIYEFYLKDKSHWTPRRLATSFGISIIRVQAILRLKALEQKMKSDGKPIQKQLTKGMESLLKAVTVHQDNPNPKEPLRYEYGSAYHPLFTFPDESESFTPEDAATILQKKPHANVEINLNTAADKAFTTDYVQKVKDSNENAEIHSQDSLYQSKFDFMFVDTSSVRFY